MRAIYDCGKYLTSFNVFEWLAQAQGKGATVVVFDIRGIRGDKWPLDVARRRFWSICEPAPALAGMVVEVFDGLTMRPTNAREIAKPGGGELVRFWRAGGRFRRFATVREPRREPFTVTLRRTQRAPGRNSDEGMWRSFATEIGARVIADYEDEQIHLHDRIALYAGARMNFFVSNGPGVLCSLTAYPCMLFNTAHARESLLGDGMADGEQYPWMLPNQRAIWELATRESLRRHFKHWERSGEFAPDGYKPRIEA